MEPNKIAPIILSIECAVGRGSVALMEGTAVLASTGAQTKSPARAEQVLLVIDSALREAGVSLRDISVIAVSVGPGSYSGIRIGLATALGLGKALSIDPIGVSVLDAIALDAKVAGRIIAAVSVGKKYAAGQSFDALGEDLPARISEPVLRSDSEFISMLASAGEVRLVCCDDLLKRCGDVVPDNVTITPLRRTIAESVGVFAASYPDKAPLQPIYLREQALTAARKE
jgi:tRNA threonylcarbamoyl adenosine modification protein YeaZ